MVLSDFEAFAALGVAVWIFWRWCQVPESSSHAAGTARESQGERTGETPNLPGACRHCEDVR